MLMGMSSVQGLTPDRRRALTREHLMAAAAEVFGEKGYEHASLDEIANRAGFTKGAVYSNFANKEELFLALVHDRRTALVQGFFDAGTPADITEVFHRLAPTPSESMLFDEFRVVRVARARPTRAPAAREPRNVRATRRHGRRADAYRHADLGPRSRASLLHALGRLGTPTRVRPGGRSRRLARGSSNISRPAAR